MKNKTQKPVITNIAPVAALVLASMSKPEVEALALALGIKPVKKSATQTRDRIMTAIKDPANVGIKMEFYFVTPAAKAGTMYSQPVFMKKFRSYKPDKIKKAPAPILVPASNLPVPPVDPDDAEEQGN